MITYSYTLADNTLGDNTTASFAVVVTDTDGDSAPAGNLVINIVDDVPTARADTDSVAAGSFVAATGNVITADGHHQWCGRAWTRWARTGRRSAGGEQQRAGQCGQHGHGGRVHGEGQYGS